MVVTEVRLTRAGSDDVSADGFELAQRELPEPAEGEVVVDVHAASLDPYQRIRMRAMPAGAVPPAGCVGQVVQSRDPGVAEGSWVTGELLWADRVVVAGSALTTVERDPRIPVHHHVGLLGLSGLTAYFGVTRVLRPQPGEKIVVSGAYGGVGQIAMQLTQRLGAEPLGIVSSEDKRTALGKHGLASLDRSDPGWVDQLGEWAPDGVDGYFDNVWGEVASRVVEHLRPLGRHALCGQMTGLKGGPTPPLDIDWYLILTRSITLQGFRTVDYLPDYAAGRRQLAEWFVEGSLDQDVNLVDGLAGAGAAFADMVSGRTLGKTVVVVR